MRKSRVKMNCGIFATVILISALFTMLVLTGTSQYVPRTGEYSSYEIAVNPPMPDFYYPLANYSLVRGGRTISMFERIGIQKFEPGTDFYQGVTNLTHRDSYGRLDIHEVPTTVIQYKALEQNALKFDMSPGTGAIRRGDSVIVGSQDAGGVFVMLGDSVAAINGNELLFDVPAGSGIIFRADTGPESPIGGAVAEGRVSAEMYLMDAGWTIGEDIVSYDDTWLYTVTASEKMVEVQVTGDSAGKAVVIHVTEPYLRYMTAGDMTVKVDGRIAKAGNGMAETLWETGDEARYFAVKTDEGFDVVVYLPENTDSVITITTADTDLGIDGAITLLAAIGIVAVAVVALMKSD